MDGSLVMVCEPASIPLADRIYQIIPDHFLSPFFNDICFLKILIKLLKVVNWIENCGHEYGYLILVMTNI